MKIIDILKTASANIWQSKLRTFLTITAIFIGAFTLTLTTGIGAGISQYIDGQVGSIGAKNVLLITAKSPSVTSGLSTTPQKYDSEVFTTQQQSGQRGGGTVTLLTNADVTKISLEKGILQAAPERYVTPSYIVGPSNQKYLLSVTEYVDGTNVAMNAGVITNNTSTERQVALPYNYVASLGFANYADAVGKTVSIGITDASGTNSEITALISGVPQKSLLNLAGATINSALFETLFQTENHGLPAAALDKYVQVIAHFDATYTDAQISDLKDRLDAMGYIGQTYADNIATIKEVLNNIVIVFDIFAIIALLAASFGVINTLLMSVQERTKEIGLMKAMGMGRSRIFLLFSAEAILLGFWGSFLGAVAAVMAGQAANYFATRGFLKDFEGLHLLAFPIANIAFIIIGIMFVAFLAGTLPARRASGLNPIDALRYE